MAEERALTRGDGAGGSAGYLDLLCAQLRRLLPALLDETRLLEETCGEAAVSRVRQATMSVFCAVNDVQDLQSLARGTLALTPEETDVRLLVDRVLARTRMAPRPSVELLYEIKDTVPRLLVLDGLRVHQVLLNLVDNALAATDSGYVTLGVAVEAMDRTSCTVLCTVTDTGVGLEARQLHPDTEGVNLRTAVPGEGLPAAAPRHRRAGSTFLPSAGGGTGRATRGAGGFGLLVTGRLLALMGSSLDLNSSVRGGGTVASFTLCCTLGEASRGLA